MNSNTNHIQLKDDRPKRSAYTFEGSVSGVIVVASHRLYEQNHDGRELTVSFLVILSMVDYNIK